MSAKESRADKDKRTVGFRVRDGKRGWMRSAVSGDPIQCGAYPEPVAMAVARDVIVASRSTTARLIRVLRARPSVALAKAIEERDAACIRTTVVEARVRVVEAERLYRLALALARDGRDSFAATCEAMEARVGALRAALIATCDECGGEAHLFAYADNAMVVFACDEHRRWLDSKTSTSVEPIWSMT